jgi:AcrR family transcriptional regulator
LELTVKNAWAAVSVHTNFEDSGIVLSLEGQVLILVKVRGSLGHEWWSLGSSGCTSLRECFTINGIRILHTACMHVNKKDQSTARTRKALEKAAKRLFETRGFSAVSAEELVAAAGVTRGALYHHYQGKEGLFEAIVEDAMRQLRDQIGAVANKASDPLAALKLGAGAFLELGTSPRLQRVLFIDAPTVMGWQRWREMDEGYCLGLVTQVLGQAIEAGQIKGPSANTIAYILVGALIEAAMVITKSENADVTRKEVQGLLDQLIRGLAS